jgi:hypothetical protein
MVPWFALIGQRHFLKSSYCGARSSLLLSSGALAQQIFKSFTLPNYTSMGIINFHKQNCLSILVQAFFVLAFIGGYIAFLVTFYDQNRDQVPRGLGVPLLSG